MNAAPPLSVVIPTLDEATAMFDPEGERLFIEECGDMLDQRTVILITHRPASLALADRIIDLSQRRRPKAASPTSAPSSG